MKEVDFKTKESYLLFYVISNEIEKQIPTHKDQNAEMDISQKKPKNNITIKDDDVPAGIPNIVQDVGDENNTKKSKRTSQM